MANEVCKASWVMAVSRQSFCHLGAACGWSRAAVSWHPFEAGAADGVFSLAVLIPSSLNSH